MEPYSPRPRAKARVKPVSSAGKTAGKYHAAKRSARVGSQAGGGFLHIAAQILDDRLHTAHHKRQTDEGKCHHDSEARKHYVDAERVKVSPEPSVRRIERGQRDACDRRRQGERKIDQRVGDALAGKAVTRQYPGNNETEDSSRRRLQGRMRQRSSDRKPSPAARSPSRQSAPSAWSRPSGKSH